MQSWCRPWPPNGSSRIRAKQKLRRKYKEAGKSSWSQIGSLKSFTLTIPWNLAKPVKIFPGITVRQHHTDRKQNGIAERAVRRIEEGTSAVLLQSGLNENCWADSMEFYCYLRNVTDLLSDGKTPNERRFGQPFKGPIIPFGSLVEYYPISAKDQSRIHQFGKTVLLGLFLGYALYAGGIWKGDLLVADLEELETMDASEIYSEGLNAKEVTFPKENGKFIFPAADGRINLSGRDQELRTPTLIQEHPIWGEGHVDFLGESEGSLPPPQDSLPDAGEAINDFWSMSGNFIFTHHIEPRVKLYSPREEWFPIPLKYIDVSRTTQTNLMAREMGPQGMSKTGGGGLVRVPNLRVQTPKFLGWHTQGEGWIDILTRYRLVGVAIPSVSRKGGRTGLPARVSGRHVVPGRQSSPIPAKPAVFRWQ